MTDRPYSGSLTPVMTLTGGNESMNVYHGNYVVVCDFRDISTERGLVLYSVLQNAHAPVYGVRIFGDDAGFVVGLVPADATAARISFDGGSIPAQVIGGVFAAWVPDGLTDQTTVIATSPTATYTIIGSRLTKHP
ncbi:MAG TPA: hypothetical protein VGJ28_20650 [Micromonosporaceae bacterium]|jgi:hypothetical protein